MQQDRRTNPYPWTWEPAAAIGLAVLVLLALGVQSGRSLALATTGHGWHWVNTNLLFGSLPGILTGHANTGLTGVPDVVPAVVLYVWIGAVEVLLVVAAAVAAKAAWERWGTSRVVGMATRADADQALGVTRLHRVRHIVRPDLYPHRPTRARREARTTR